MQKRQWEGQELADAKIADIPISFGLYVIPKYDAGRSVLLTRNTTPSKLAKYQHNANLTLNAGIDAMMSHVLLLVMLYNRSSRTKSHQV